MGKNQKIPYLNEVLIYIFKVILIFILLNYFISRTSLYNQTLIAIISVFFAFSFNPIYLSMISASYLISFFVYTFNIGDFGLLLLYLFTVLLNTFFMIIFLKFKYKFKEED